ncbi:hypothetical protein ACFQ3M_13165, partial [Micromonospora andamanensis]
MRVPTRLTCADETSKDQERIYIVAYQPGPNDLLRAARLAMRSPSGSGRPMSRQELAEAVNAWLYEHAGRRFAIHAGYIGNLERGTTRWPSAHYRTGLRAVLGKATDAELGFFIIQGHAKDRDRSMVGQAPATGRPDAAADICPANSPAVATGQSATAPGGLPVASAGAAAVRVSVGSGVAPWSWTLEPWIVMVWGDQESLTDGDEALSR